MAKELSELEQFRIARAAPHDQLVTRDQPAVIEGHPIHHVPPEQPSTTPLTVISCSQPQEHARAARVP